MVDAIKEMDHHSLGVILIKTAENTLAGIITDGDIRRAIARQDPILETPVDALMTDTPLHFPPDAPAYDALNMMERHQITVLPIIAGAVGKLPAMAVKLNGVTAKTKPSSGLCCT